MPPRRDRPAYLTDLDDTGKGAGKAVVVAADGVTYEHGDAAGGAPLSDADPLPAAEDPDPGEAEEASRADHVHPHDPDAIRGVWGELEVAAGDTDASIAHGQADAELGHFRVGKNGPIGAASDWWWTADGTEVTVETDAAPGVTVPFVWAFSRLQAVEPPALHPYVQAVLDDSPLAYWRFEETSGLLAADSSGNARDADVTVIVDLTAGSLVASDPSASAAGFPNSTAARVNRASAPWMAVSSITVEAWVKTSVASLQSIVTRDDLASGAVRQF
jgi:hypothetical protein